MKFKLVEDLLFEEVVKVYRGVAPEYERFDKGVSWWTIDKQDAIEYTQDHNDTGVVLESDLELSNPRIIKVSDFTIEDIYINDDILDACNLELIDIGEREVKLQDRENNEVVTLLLSLGSLQPFINKRLSDAGYQAIFATFNYNGKKVNEIAVFDDTILDYEHPDWYQRGN